MVVFILPHLYRTRLTLSPEWESTCPVEILLEWSRTDPDSELRVKQHGEQSLALKLFPDCVTAGNVDVY